VKRAATWLGLAALVAVGVDALADLTQNRPDAPLAGSRSEILVEITNRNVYSSPLEGAQGLWGVCQGTVRQRLLPPGVVALGDDRFLVTTEPALGQHAWRRLRGCLEDHTLDAVLARVVRKQDFAPSGR
jgi:hypothetical protein